MARIPEVGGRNHKDLLVEIKMKEEEAQRLIHEILQDLLNRKTNELTEDQLIKLGLVRGFLSGIRTKANEGVELITSAQRAAEKKIYQFKRASGDE